MRPIEWLNGLIERPDGYRRLFDEAGGLAVAAWRLAQARCEVFEVSSAIPSSSELRAAARELSQHLGLVAPLPSGAALANECESLGLLVI